MIHDKALRPVMFHLGNCRLGCVATDALPTDITASALEPTALPIIWQALARQRPHQD